MTGETILIVMSALALVVSALTAIWMRSQARSAKQAIELAKADAQGNGRLLGVSIEWDKGSGYLVASLRSGASSVTVTGVRLIWEFEHKPELLGWGLYRPQTTRCYVAPWDVGAILDPPLTASVRLEPNSAITGRILDRRDLWAIEQDEFINVKVTVVAETTRGEQASDPFIHDFSSIDGPAFFRVSPAVSTHVFHSLIGAWRLLPKMAYLMLLLCVKDVPNLTKIAAFMDVSTGPISLNLSNAPAVDVADLGIDPKLPTREQRIELLKSIMSVYEPVIAKRAMPRDSPGTTPGNSEDTPTTEAKAEPEPKDSRQESRLHGRRSGDGSGAGGGDGIPVQNPPD